MDDRVLNAALAGLVHDIGKFAQRAGEETRGEWGNEASKEFRYHHALLTARFARRYLPEGLQAIGVQAAHHHAPTSHEELVIRIADRLAAGERVAPRDADDSDRGLHPKQMLSIFCSITGPDGETTPPGRYLRLQPLRLDRDTLFPADPISDESQVWQAYETRWDEFCRRAKALKNAYGNLETYLESMLLLMQEYTWSIPAAYFKSRPDVSLYDHSRLAAALAAILASSDLDSTVWEQLKSDPAACHEPVALLIGGDLSGVQDFIYTITNKGAVSALRGRSFYLQLLTEAAARYLLRGLGLPIINLIYASGGNFYLFARAQDAGKLDEIRRKISRSLYRHHRGDLYLAVASLPVRANEFFIPEESKPHPFSARWNELGQRLAAAKLRRFSEWSAEEWLVVLAPEGHGGNEDKECQVCGREDPGTAERDGVRKCPPCLSYEELGRRLRNARYLAFNYPEPTDPPSVVPALKRGGWKETLQHLGLDVDLEPPTAAPPRLRLALDDDALGGLEPGPRTAIGRRLLANVTPLLSPQQAAAYSGPKEKLEAGGIKTFNVLAQQSQGIKRLGILRMDVDDLGRIFARGLRDATPSRMATLSFAISLFFEGWVARIAEDVSQELGKVEDEKTKKPRGDVLYSIYSGGDDLCFVGAWDAVVELARRVRADLTPYAADHPGIHVSAGIVLATERYPLAKAAQEAKNAEDDAKSHPWWSPERTKWLRKDALCFLGQTLPWARFGLPKAPSGNGDVASLMDLIKKELDRKSANRSILRLMLQLFTEYEQAEDERHKKGGGRKADGSPQPLWGRWNWLVFYFLRNRLARRDSPLWKMADALNTNPDLMPQVALAARWAELLTRRGG